MPTTVVLYMAALLAADDSASLYDKIFLCKDDLKDEKPVSDRITGEDAVLCILPPGEGASHLLARVRGGISRTPRASVELLRRNGVNSNYRVIKPEGGKVLAIKTNVTGSRKLIGHKRIRVPNARGRWEWKRVQVYKDRAVPAVYAPWSEAVSTPEVVQAGFGYTLSTIDAAQDYLDEREIRTLTEKDAPAQDRKRVTELVPERVNFALLMIEHIDPDWVKDDAYHAYRVDTAKLRRYLDMVLATVGLNREESYDFSVSSAKASGFAQFIPGTYAMIRKEYPDAGFIPGFVEGMRNHRNAVAAQFCLLDFSLAELKKADPEAFRRLTDGAHEEDLGAWLAAAYNAGAHRAAPLIRDAPDRWEDPALWKERFKITTTPKYIKEFRAVYRMLFSESAAPILE